MGSRTTPIEPELADDDLPPDEDDFDAVDFSDPEESELAPPPVKLGPGDQAAAGHDPVPPAEQDAPADVVFPEGDLAAPGPAAAGPAEPDDAVVLRWRARLKRRKLTLAAAQAELARAQTPAEIAAATANVAKCRARVAAARRVLARRTTTVTDRLIRAASLAMDNEPLVRYTMDRPLELTAQGGQARRWDGIRLGLRSKNGQFPRFADCSSFVTWCYWDALGGPNAGPDIINGQSWSGGFTGTQTAHGRQVPIAEARAGDLAFYDRGGTIGHVALVVAPGRVISHGSERGPVPQAINADKTLKQVRRYLA